MRKTLILAMLLAAFVSFFNFASAQSPKKTLIPAMVLIPDDQSKFNEIINGDASGTNQIFTGVLQSSMKCNLSNFETEKTFEEITAPGYEQPVYVYLKNFTVKRDGKESVQNILISFESTGFIAYFSGGNIERCLGLTGQQSYDVVQPANSLTLKGTLTFNKYVYSGWMDASWVKDTEFKYQIPVFY